MKNQSYVWHPNTQMSEWSKFPKIIRGEGMCTGCQKQRCKTEKAGPASHRSPHDRHRLPRAPFPPGVKDRRW